MPVAAHLSLISAIFKFFRRLTSSSPWRALAAWRSALAWRCALRRSSGRRTLPSIWRGNVATLDDPGSSNLGAARVWKGGWGVGAAGSQAPGAR
jgi:hypothetical protein